MKLTLENPVHSGIRRTASTGYFSRSGACEGVYHYHPISDHLDHQV